MYGAILGAVLHSLHLPIGATMLEAIKLVGNAAIPTVMLVLGIQLANVRIKIFLIALYLFHCYLNL